MKGPLAGVVRDWEARLQQMAADPEDLIDGEMARELLAAAQLDGCAECTESGGRNCVAGCKPL